MSLDYRKSTYSARVEDDLSRPSRYVQFPIYWYVSTVASCPCAQATNACALVTQDELQDDERLAVRGPQVAPRAQRGGRTRVRRPLRGTLLLVLLTSISLHFNLQLQYFSFT